MRRAIIIDTYPSGARESEILSQCIDSVKPLGYDIVITSHLPIDVEICKKAELVVYDSNNTFLPPDRTPFFWFKCNLFDIHIFNAGHTLPICRNMRNGLQMAKSLGYEEFIFTESDVIFSLEDLNKLKDLIDKMSEEGKTMLFFRPEEYRDCENSYVYETLIFGGNINYFLNTFNPPKDIADWDELNMGYTLELSFYEQFSFDESKFLLVNDHSSRIFTTSKVNISRYGLFNCDVLFSEKYPDEPVLYIMHSLVNPEPKYIEIFINGSIIYSSYLYQSTYWFDSYKFNDDEITVNVYDADDKKYLFMSKSFVLSKSNIDTFKQKGIINFK